MTIDPKTVCVCIDRDGDVVTADSNGLLVAVPGHDVPGLDRTEVASHIERVWNNDPERIVDRDLLGQPITAADVAKQLPRDGIRKALHALDRSDPDVQEAVRTLRFILDHA